MNECFARSLKYLKGESKKHEDLTLCACTFMCVVLFFFQTTTFLEKANARQPSFRILACCLNRGRGSRRLYHQLIERSFQVQQWLAVQRWGSQFRSGWRQFLVFFFTRVPHWSRWPVPSAAQVSECTPAGEAPVPGTCSQHRSARSVCAFVVDCFATRQGACNGVPSQLEAWKEDVSVITADS